MSAVLKPASGSAMQFSPMEEPDLDPVLAIERAIYAFPWTRGNFRDSLRAGYSCWSARAGGELIGYAVMMLAAGEAHLLNLSIAAGRQQRGHGRALLAHLVAVARGHGARVLFLEVRPSNDAGKRLYAGFGFEQIGVRRGYYPAHEGREDALVFSLNL
jgi:[ribosomal protein S18]-alanine N-acetyltransferase